MDMKLNLSKIWLYVFAFVLMYQPNFSYLIKIDNHVLFFIFIAIFSFKPLMTKNKDFINMFKRKPIVLFIFFCFLATTYRVLRTGFNSVELNELLSITIQGLFPILYLTGALSLNYELANRGYDNKRKIKFILQIALFQGIISILMLIIPAFKQIAINIYYNGGPATNFYITQNRLHGICDGDYTYGFQILHSLLALVSIFYAYYYKEKKYYLFSLIIFAVTLLNGRSGIIIFTIGLILFALDIIKKKNGLLKVGLLVPIVLIIITVAIAFIEKYLPNTYSLIDQAIRDVSRTLSGDTNTETGSLLSMILFPTGIYLLIGRGFRIYGNGGRTHNFIGRSDIGYVNELFIGGFIYMFLLYTSYYHLISFSLKNTKKASLEKFILVVTLITMAFANVKGEAFRQPLLITNFILIFVSFFPFSFYKKRIIDKGDNNEKI